MMWLQQVQKSLYSSVSTWLDSVESAVRAFAARCLTKVAELRSVWNSSELDAAAAGSDVVVSEQRAQGVWNGSWETRACESSYWAESTASAETLWKMVTDLADLSTWHPLITSTNAPRGQRAKPGLIYRAVMPYLPISTQIFVERVLPGELLSIRLFPLPGLQERVTYRIVSTLCGTCVLYSITLSGWLSPLAWPMVKPHATKVAAALVEAAEQHMLGESLKQSAGKTDIFGSSV